MSDYVIYAFVLFKDQEWRQFEEYRCVFLCKQLETRNGCRNRVGKLRKLHDVSYIQKAPIKMKIRCAETIRIEENFMTYLNKKKT